MRARSTGTTMTADRDHFERSLTVATPGTAIDLLAAETALSRTRIKDAMAKGAVWRTQGKHTSRIRRANSPVEAGDQLSIHYNNELLTQDGPDPELHQDGQQWAVWIKPSGVRTTGSRFCDHLAMTRKVSLKTQREVYLVHRLDQFTCGLMLIASNRRTAATLAGQFEARRVHKAYLAVVHGRLNEAQGIDLPIDDKEAFSEAVPLDASQDLSLIRVRITTGRKHQIRRHLATIGHPVVGDRQYGYAGAFDLAAGLQLVATELGFECPETGDHVSCRLPTTYHPDPGALRALRSDHSA
ncbi:MAG: RNA pseudouridine synthase [Gammaproteobacteria bacterium]|uniref:RNA pseudouridine synthase n=1 Tax=OM182 bacterium MED-G24 TaxID=1986255 RepID=A0A2A5WWI0_9GAMM|nr:RNA pseudouridine synthase [Gammaproteobacteria bacterium]PDH40577.1 MAG: RNA pseudouridine synthase [OM182 bacterium MED-G24]RPG26024.1 MAG: RluA family pseudouridine synthase [Gammaproteobacteria bacterium TMED50]